MLKTKRLKDPIYGYIEISKNIMDTIVDTAEFQRLRDVIQTSYSPLYSSAVHNRFVHSLGVYHLGGIVSKSLKDKVVLQDVDFEIERYLYLFEIACLLHDLGHAPFSHTGEEYYLTNGKRDELHSQIIDLTKDEDLAKEIGPKNYKAAPHELMSVIVSLRDFDFLFTDNDEKSFFARCILGYPYSEKNDLKHSVLNCIISFLNSSVIDVDKLDYLIRDAYLTGFDTVSIDYERLLKSINLIKMGGKYVVVYDKSAISVIENVVYAHDAERKWIQNHPIVQYEAYLLKTAIDALKEKYKEINIFSYESLTSKGISLSEEFNVSLLSDSDIVFLIKNLKHSSIDEYFQRRTRRHPLWKSESEYKAIFNKGYGTSIFEKIEMDLDDLCKRLNFVCKSQEINQAALDACKADLEAEKKMAEQKPQSKAMFQLTIQEKEKYVKWLEVFKDFAEKQNILFDFVILKANQFNSGFAKDEFGKILISFDSLSEPCQFKDVTNVLKADKSTREKFFYLYYRKDSDTKRIDVNNLAVLMGKIALTEVYKS